MSLKINFYCDEQYKDLVPEPICASKYFPKWFSELPFDSNKFKLKFSDGDPYNLTKDTSGHNVKKCLGIVEFLNTGYIIPSWADFIFREQENGQLYVNWMNDSWGKTTYKSHLPYQYETMPNKPIYGHFGKVFTPWVIKTDPGVSCLITNPVWHRNTSFTTATAIIHSDVSPIPLAWFFEWNHKIQTGMRVDPIDEKQIVPKYESLLLIVPFYRKTFSSNVNYVSEKKINTLNKLGPNFTQNSIFTECPYKNFRKNLGKLFQ